MITSRRLVGFLPSSILSSGLIFTACQILFGRLRLPRAILTYYFYLHAADEIHFLRLQFANVRLAVYKHALVMRHFVFEESGM